MYHYPPHRRLDALFRNNLAAFAEKAFVEFNQTNFSYNWHIAAICHLLEQVEAGKIKRLLVTLPPRSLKSHLASVCFPAWLLGRDPSRKIICASYGDSLATDFSNGTRLLMKTAWYRRLFPDLKLDPRKDTQTELRTTLGGFRLATTVGGPLTGRGGDYLVIDDPMKQVDAESEIAREKVIKWFNETLLSRLNSKSEGAIIVIMQRLHVEDLAGHLLEKGGWHVLNLPAIAQQNEAIPLSLTRFHHRKAGDALHPERESLEILAGLSAQMGEIPFAGQYLQMPIAHGGNLVKIDWFRIYHVAPPATYPATIVQSWDTASKSGELNDYSVCITALVIKDFVYILDVFRRRLDYPDLKKAVISLKARWRANAVLIEDKGSGQSLIQDLKREFISVKAIEPAGDKIVRMSAVSARIENGEVYLPAAADWLELFKAEIMAFPRGKHDDQVDALSQLLSYKKRHSLYTLETIGE
ncbi:MAG: phage terminase large subunit [Rhizobiaceae bacterium]|nr:phage terminase large subunit [Rhizobiaceae bacterium]